MNYLCLFILSTAVGLSVQRSTPEDDHYVAAVVEYNVNSDVAANLVKYAELAHEAAEQFADIVVFPELTLTNRTVMFSAPIHGLLRQYPIPALHPDLYDEILVAMSSVARNNGIYLVVNGQELMDCTKDTGEVCPEAKEYFFNTNLVFDRSGAVIDRFRKINLFGEPSRTPALQPDLGVFTTDFGVTFGHFICFDLMFQVPAVQVVQKNNLKNVIFPTMWFSELPYLTAVQIQEAYAYALDVNFLGSGANRPQVGSAGSGIYSGKAGALISTMPGVATTKVLVARVPKVPGQVTWPVPGPIYDNPTDHDSLHLIVDPSVPSHVSQLLEEGAQEFTLVDKDVSCHFKVKISPRDGAPGVKFRAFVQDGSNTYARREAGVAACSIVACKTEDIKTCVYRFKKLEETTIEELEIQMTTYRTQYNDTLQCDNIVYFPVSVRYNKFPLNPKNFTFTTLKEDEIKCESTQEYMKYVVQNEICENNKQFTLNYKINGPQNELVAFGIWGRIYTRDVDHNKGGKEEVSKEHKDAMDRINEYMGAR